MWSTKFDVMRFTPIRLFVILMTIVGVLWIPIVQNVRGEMFVYIQAVASYFSPPLTCLFLVVIFWKRCTEKVKKACETPRELSGNFNSCYSSSASHYFTAVFCMKIHANEAMGPTCLFWSSSPRSFRILVDHRRTEREA